MSYCDQCARLLTERDALTARVRELEGALAVRPKKPRRNETQLYHLGNMNGEDAWQKGWQEALTAMGTARKAALTQPQKGGE
jgi:hypothetical protein